MNVTPEIVAEARSLAEKNYTTWGQWIVETHTNAELAEELARHETLSAWVKLWKDVASIYSEREASW